MGSILAAISVRHAAAPQLAHPDLRRQALHPAVTTEKGRSNLVKVNVASRKTCYDGRPRRLRLHRDAGRDEVRPCAIATRTRSGTSTSSTRRPASSRARRAERRALRAVDLSKAEEIWYDSFDGKKINGWIVKRPDQAGRKYPFIVQTHGGPHTAYGDSSTHESAGRRRRDTSSLYEPARLDVRRRGLANVIQYKYPGDDYKDIMAGVDEVLKRGYVDEKKLGVTGGSGGGLHRTGPSRRRTGSRGGVAAVRRRPEFLLVQRGLHALHAVVVPKEPVPGPGGVPRARRCDTWTDQDPIPSSKEKRTGDAAVAGRRRDVPRAQGGEEADGDGDVPGREPRALAFGDAVSPGRAAAAHRELVRQTFRAKRCPSPPQ